MINGLFRLNRTSNAFSGFSGVLSGLGDAPQQRAVTLSGGMSLNSLFYFDSVETWRGLILQAFNDNGFSVTLNNLTQEGTQCGISLTAQVWDTMSADTFRNAAIGIIKSVQNGYIIKDDVFSNVFMQIVSDGVQKISPDISNEVPKTNVTTTKILTKTAENIANEVADKGVAGTGLKGLAALLFGAGHEDIDILGFKANKIAVIGAVGLGAVLYLKNKR